MYTMRKNTATFLTLSVILAAAAISASGTRVYAADCGCATPVVAAPTVVRYAPAPVTTWQSSYVTQVSQVTPVYTVNRIETAPANQLVEEDVTTYEVQLVPEKRIRKYTINRQVPETSSREERYKVLKPVWETQWQDSSFDVIRSVPETTYQEKRTVVSRPVTETEEREVYQTVRRPVQQTVMQEKTYTVNRPQTTFQTQVVDRGGFVDEMTKSSPQTYNRLTWQAGGSFVDPQTGLSRRYLPGLYWTPMQSEPRYEVTKVYKPNLVTEQIPVTTYSQETIVEQIPVNVTTYQEEKIVRKEPVQVQRMVQEEIVETVPITTYKQVVERVAKQTPVRVCRMETEEVVRQIPVTTYKLVVEEKEEEYTVQVPKQVAVTRKVQKLVPISASQTPVSQTPTSQSQTTYRPTEETLPGPSVQEPAVAPLEPVKRQSDTEPEEKLSPNPITSTLPETILPKPVTFQND